MTIAATHTQPAEVELLCCSCWADATGDSYDCYDRIDYYGV